MAEEFRYTSQARIERVKGPVRRAYLPWRDEPIFFGTHPDIAPGYGTDPTAYDPQTTTLDYVVAAAAG